MMNETVKFGQVMNFNHRDLDDAGFIPVPDCEAARSGLL
jgi:hypothetical protein